MISHSRKKHPPYALIGCGREGQATQEAVTGTEPRQKCPCPEKRKRDNRKTGKKRGKARQGIGRQRYSRPGKVVGRVRASDRLCTVVRLALQMQRMVPYPSPPLILPGLPLACRIRQGGGVVEVNRLPRGVPRPCPRAGFRCNHGKVR